ncbi:MAG: MmgE/PrpD family protein [Proteobacteria bacterium]|nr:MmgE/PrpD family protein [Burkholderiales bacterium]
MSAVLKRQQIDDATAQVAAFVVDTRTADIPPPVLDRARDAIVDTLGCGLAGSKEEVSRIALQWVDELGGREQSSLWGTGIRTSVAEAAFANGIFAHALDFDDSLPTLRGHPSAPIVAAALAVGEAAGSSGKDVLTAYAVGLDIAGKLGSVLGNEHYLQGWHNTSTVGTFTATAVSARLWKLDAIQLRMAWGLAASQMSGLVRNFGSMAKPFHVGRAARAGVMSAWLAKKGFTADPSIFDGRNNVLQTYFANDVDGMNSVVSRLGAPWEAQVPGNWVKRWPCCYCSHRAIGGLFALMKEHRLEARDITAIHVGFLPGTDAPLISTDPQTGLEGKFSVEYSLAAAALDGTLTLESFTDEMVQRPAARALLGKVKRYPIADSRVYGLDAHTELVVETAQGKVSMTVERTPGSPAWPLTQADRDEKFLDCAGRVLSATNAAELLAYATRFDAIENIGHLMTVAPGLRRPGT